MAIRDQVAAYRWTGHRGPKRNNDAHSAVLDGPQAGTTLGQIVMVATDWAVRRRERITGVVIWCR